MGVERDNDPRGVVMHHSEGYQTAEEIDADHRRRPWKDSRGVVHIGYLAIGYHWVIEPNRLVSCAILGRPEWMHGAHCPPMNRRSLGVCLVGNFLPGEQKEPTRFQKIALARLVRLKMLQYDFPRTAITLHKTHVDTDCPGTITREKVLQWISEY